MKKAQLSLEFLLAFAFLLASLLILGIASSAHLSTFQKSLHTSLLETQLSAISLNLGVLYASTNSTSIAPSPPSPDLGAKIGISKNIIFFSKDARVPTINPGSGGEYSYETSIPN